MTPKQRASLYIISALILLFILAAGLNAVELKPGELFDIRKAAPISGIGAVGPESDLWLLFLRGIVTLAAILLPFYIIYMLLDPRRRKRLLAQLISYGLFILAMIMLQNYLASRQTKDQDQPTPAVPANMAQNSGPQGSPVSFDAKPSDAAVTVTGIIIGVLGVGILALGWWMLVGKRKPPVKILEKVAQEAEETLDSLLSGKDLRETILMCYRRMTEIAVKNRGIPREASVTPHEFEQTLVEKGLPSTSVHELTHIFEDIRYGDFKADEDGRRRATLALRTIIAACRKQESQAA
jgi:hypothetical protein